MKPTRREFIGMGLGFVGAAAASACGLAGLGGVALLRHRAREERVVVVVPETATLDLRSTEIAAVQPPIITRESWGALAPDLTAENENGFFADDNPFGWQVYTGDLREIYKTVVVHHSVVDEGDDLSTLAEIQRLHRQDRGWADVAYHYFIGKGDTPTLYEGRSMSVRGTHVGGFNTGSVGVCLLGNYMDETPTDAQLGLLTQTVAWLKLRLDLTHLAAHRDFNDNTVCPGDNLVNLLSTLAEDNALMLGTGGYIAPATAEPTSQSGCCCCHV